MMVDDQERWEWVNVSSVTGSPRYSWTNGSKMVVALVTVILNIVKC